MDGDVECRQVRSTYESDAYSRWRRHARDDQPGNAGQAKGFSIGAGLYLVVALAIGLVSVLATGGDKPPIGVAIMFLMMAGVFFGGAQIGTCVHAKRQRGKFERALDRIELVARESQHLMPEREASPATPSSKPAVQESRTPEIDLDALPEPEDFGSQRDPAERTRL